MNHVELARFCPTSSYGDRIIRPRILHATEAERRNSLGVLSESRTYTNIGDVDAPGKAARKPLAKSESDDIRHAARVYQKGNPGGLIVPAI